MYGIDYLVYGEFGAHVIRSSSSYIEDTHSAALLHLLKRQTNQEHPWMDFTSIGTHSATEPGWWSGCLISGLG